MDNSARRKVKRIQDLESTRLKRAGMRWSLRGANAIAALRCCRLSGRYEDFWDWRTKRDAMRAA